VKKSKFKAFAARADSVQLAQAYLLNVSDPQATHNCWAYRGQFDAKCSDDGEPGGTAGKPILSAIEAANVHNVVVVVTRYYGGIKLGAGGLSRAYYSAARLALQKATKVELIRYVTISVTVRAEDLWALYSDLGQFTIDQVDDDHTDSLFRSKFDLSVDVELVSVAISRIPENEVDAMTSKLTALCKGRIMVHASD
jgi:putative IMPACT (imprinted ancient) family translation regulator